jgi:hypothetical protein
MAQSSRNFLPVSNGPDMLVEAHSFTSSKLNQAVRLRIGEVDWNRYVPISIYSLFKKTVDKKPEHKAICFKSSNAQREWAYFTYEEYFKICNKAAKSFIKVFNAF